MVLLLLLLKLSHIEGDYSPSIKSFSGGQAEEFEGRPGLEKAFTLSGQPVLLTLKGIKDGG